jgi:hypothetical protein
MKTHKIQKPEFYLLLYVAPSCCCCFNTTTKKRVKFYLQVVNEKKTERRACRTDIQNPYLVSLEWSFKNIIKIINSNEVHSCFQYHL